MMDMNQINANAPTPDEIMELVRENERLTRSLQRRSKQMQSWKKIAIGWFGDYKELEKSMQKFALEQQIKALEQFTSTFPSMLRKMWSAGEVRELVNEAIERLQAQGEQMSYPAFLLELSKQLNEQPSRCTSHPFYQVRCKRKYPTAEGYDEAGYWIGDDKDFQWDSNINEMEELAEYLRTNYSEWLETDFDEYEYNSDLAGMIDVNDLPEEFNLVHYQLIEEVVSTHLTLAAAEQFIKRKQHDYPRLYTYAASAYWSPQLRELQDWLKGLTESEKAQGEQS